MNNISDLDGVLSRVLAGLRGRLKSLHLVYLNAYHCQMWQGCDFYEGVPPIKSHDHVMTLSWEMM